MTQSLLHRNVQNISKTIEETPMPVEQQTATPTAELPESQLDRAVERQQINPQATETEADSSKSVKPPAEHEAQATSAKRDGDSGLGRRKPKVPAVDTSDWERIEPTSSSTVEPEPEKELSACLYAPTLLCKTLRWGLLFLSAIAIFFIVTQTASFLSDMRRLSLAEQILLSIPLVIFGGIILWLIIKVLLLTRRLRVSPQIRIKALQELEDRKSLRKAALKSNREAVEKLSSFLKLSLNSSDEKYLALGFTVEDVRTLKKHRDFLIQEAENPSGTSQDWIADFRQQIQEPLDKIAKKRILRYSMNTAIMTGISPFSLIDRLIVLSACLSMLKDLLEIYALKPSWDKNLVLMGQVIVNTYLAGVIDDVTEAGIDGITEITGGTFQKIPDYALRWAGKTAETAIQGYMVYRLGMAAVRILHPVSVPADKTIVSSLMEKLFHLSK